MQEAFDAADAEWTDQGWVVRGEFLDLTEFRLRRLPLFAEIHGSIDCRHNELYNLVGSPQEVGGNFDCSYSGLNHLEGAPQKVGGDFNCSGNSLFSLEGAPQSVGGNFDCSDNENEEFTSLEGIGEVGGEIYYDPDIDEE